ncbi:flagellar biosynthetic protein FliO [Rhizobium sp. SL42]|nr:flagellar biosynthetic protein FliO [Rhizobium sp. SL42]UJW73983.1 flagellar biosynthetic protein FliO [Rhizobium sp. SL42]
MLDELISAYGNRLLVAALGVALALLCLFIVLWLMRNRASSPFVRGGRNRQPRLQVLDAAAVDARRRIVLIRRDNVEHLVMIGGPTDIVIESGIGDDRAYLSTLAVQPQAQALDASPNLPHTESAKIVALQSVTEPAEKSTLPTEVAVAADLAMAEPEPVRSTPPPASAQVEPAAPVRPAQPAGTVPAPKVPPAARAPISAAAPIPVVTPPAVLVAPAIAATTIPVMTAQATLQQPMPSNETKPSDQLRSQSATTPTQMHPEPRLDVVAPPVAPAIVAPPVAVAPIVETVQSPSIPAPVEIPSPVSPGDTADPITIAPEVSHQPHNEQNRKPQFEQPVSIGRAPEVPSIASPAVPAMPVHQIPPVEIASEAVPARAPDVTAPDAADILEAARARVLPLNAAERPGAAQPFAAERFVPQHEPINVAQAEEPARDMSDFERVLEEEMALHLAADPLPLPQDNNIRGDGPTAQPFLPEIRSDRPGLPVSAILPEGRHATPPVARPSANADGTPDEPNLQNEIARIFGEMSASRNS